MYRDRRNRQKHLDRGIEEMNRHNHRMLISTYVVVTILAFTLIGVIYWSGHYEMASVDNDLVGEENELIKEDLEQTNTDLEQEEGVAEGIVCWGDSLTHGIAGGYPKILEDLLAQEGEAIPVENKGVSGEGTIAIMNRAGAIASFLSQKLVIPSEIDTVEFNLVDQEGNTYKGLPCGQHTACLITIAGVQGKVVEGYANGKSIYKFTRLFKGERVEADQGTKISYDFMNPYEHYIPIIFIGTNGGWGSIEELIEQQQEILDVFPKNDRFIIIGLTYQHIVDFDELDQAMEEHWGEHYINLREYFTGQGIYDAGITPSSYDLAQMKEGIVPDCIRSDYVHYTNAGYKALGELLYRRLDDLNYVQ